VEEVLRRDAAGVYARMDFATRDRYRKAVEDLARGSGRDEVAVAREAVRRGELRPEGSRGRHVGFHLVDAGRPALEEGLGVRRRPAARLRRGLMRFARPLYFGSIALGTAAALAGFLAVAAAGGAGPAGLTLVAVLALVPAVTLAVSVVQFLVGLALPPRVLPKMDFEEGIPEEARTLVVVPTLLTGVDDLAGLLRSLEMNWLGSARGALSFALLTDFTDAPEREMPEDAQLLAAAVRGIEGLNERYRDGDRADRGRPPFLLLHRDREWNPVEKVWMGWERKRGKLTELNCLLAGEPASGLRIRAGDPERLRGVAFVVTLDSDTHMPSGAAGRMAAALAHPLNRPEIDPETGRVVAGYTVIQPRLEVQPASANRTLFSRLFAGDAGLDPYTLAVSDVYQDLFGEGIYAGKGIYDVAAFQRSLAGPVPENRLLSHDLFEGVHGRAGLASTSTSGDDFRRLAGLHMRRLHRWVRGDWQMLPWLSPRVPAPPTGGRPSPTGSAPGSLEDPRQPATEPAGSLPARAAARRLGPGGRIGVAVDRARRSGPRRAQLPGCRGRGPTPHGGTTRAPEDRACDPRAAPPAGGSDLDRGRSVDPGAGPPPVRGDGLGRCDRPHRGPGSRDAAAPPPVDDRRHHGPVVGAAQPGLGRVASPRAGGASGDRGARSDGPVPARRPDRRG
jgi:cyclic beta-1,2-glucan synthetase